MFTLLKKIKKQKIIFFDRGLAIFWDLRFGTLGWKFGDIVFSVCDLRMFFWGILLHEVGFGDSATESGIAYQTQVMFHNLRCISILPLQLFKF